MLPTTIMLELGNEDGLLIGQNVFPGSYANAHIIVFHRRRLPDLVDQINQSIKWVFDIFKPAIMAAWIPEFNIPARRLAERLDWTFDGIIRGMLAYGGERVDAVIYSITKEEANGRI
jgi:hypothetical protein